MKKHITDIIALRFKMKAALGAVVRGAGPGAIIEIATSVGGDYLISVFE